MLVDQHQLAVVFLHDDIGLERFTEVLVVVFVDVDQGLRFFARRLRGLYSRLRHRLFRYLHRRFRFLYRRGRSLTLLFDMPLIPLGIIGRGIGDLDRALGDRDLRLVEHREQPIRFLLLFLQNRLRRGLYRGLYHGLFIALAEHLLRQLKGIDALNGLRGLIGQPCFHALFAVHQGGFHRVIDRVEHGTFVDETYLELGRMDVDVHRVEGHVEVEHAGREFAYHHAPLAGFADRRHRGLADDEAAVDEEVLHIAVGACVLGTADVARNTDAAQRVVHGDQALCEITAVDGVDRRQELCISRGTQNGLLVFDISQRDLGVRQRDLVDDVRYGVALRHIGLEEFHAGGHVVEQVADDEGGAVGTADVLKADLLAALDQIACAGLFLTRFGDQLEVGHGGYARQRLSAKA